MQVTSEAMDTAQSVHTPHSVSDAESLVHWLSQEVSLQSTVCDGSPLTALLDPPTSPSLGTSIPGR